MQLQRPSKNTQSLIIALAKWDIMACAQTGSRQTAAFLMLILSQIDENGPQDTSESGYDSK